MVKFNDIKFEDIIQDVDNNIPNLLQLFLNKVRSDPNICGTIGWRDVESSKAYKNGWTYKIHGFKGIFGLYFDNSVQTDDWLIGYFGMTYFPHPDEKLVERFSLKAAYQSQQADYIKKIERFMVYPEMQALFEVGRFSLAFNRDDTALMLSLYALSRHKVVNIEGVATGQSEPPSYLIEPNGTDQNLPSFVIAYGLFKVLAATVTFCIQQAPVYLRRDKRRGNHFSLSHDGYHNVEPSSLINEIELHLGYEYKDEDADFEQLIESCTEELPDLLESALWKTGEAYPEFAKTALWWTAHQIAEM